MSECNVNEIMSEASCFACLPPEQLSIIQTELLCRIYNELSGEISGYTPGSVIFAGSDGSLSEDNPNLFYNETTKFLEVAGFSLGGITPADVATTPGTAGGKTFTAFGAGLGFAFSTINDDATVTSALPTGGNTTIATTGVGGGGGGFYIKSGLGGQAPNAAVSSTGGTGGIFQLHAGAGGAAAVDGTGNNTGGIGGSFLLNSAAGGAATGVTTGINTGGNGGSNLIFGGAGGAASGGASNVGGTGGAVSVSGGSGGIGTTSGGNGGAVTVQGGAAAAMVGAAGGAVTVSGRAGSSTGTGGVGGNATLQAGSAGGDNTVNRAGGAVAITAGLSKGSQTGGAITLTGGAGGLGTGTAGANGGSININPGAGGVGSATGGTGGSTFIRGGLGGASGSPGAGGAIIFEVAATTTLIEAARFNPATGNFEVSTRVLLSDGSAAAPSVAFVNGPTSGLAFASSRVDAIGGGSEAFAWYSGNVLLGSATIFSWSSGSPSSGSPDLSLHRDAANILAQRNGTSAQEHRVYKTFTDTGNYVRGSLRWNTDLEIGTFSAGTGTVVSQNLYFVTAGTRRWVIADATGHLTANADNTYDIGASATGRPANIYVGTALRAAFVGPDTAVSLNFQTTGSSRWQITTSGHLLSLSDNNHDIGANGATRPRTGYFGTSVVAPLFNAATAFLVSGTQVLANRNTGWTAPTGTAQKTGFATYTAQNFSAIYVESEMDTLAAAVQDNSRSLKAVIDALITHGLLGT